MARSPLIIQQPQASLIGGNQLPQASGAGVPTPDLSGIIRFSRALAEKDDRNKKLEDGLRGQADAGTFIGKDANGAYIELPTTVNDRESPEYNAAYINTREQQYRHTIQSDVTTRMNQIFEDPTLDDATKLARMQAVVDGTVKALPPVMKASGMSIGMQEFEQRKNTIASQALARDRENLLNGIKTQITDSTNMAISASASGAASEVERHRLEAFAAYDRLVDLKVMSAETAESAKLNMGRFVNAIGTQQRIATQLFDGNIDPADLDRFISTLRAGGDAELVSEKLRGATNFNTEKERQGEYEKRELYKTADLRKAFGDPDLTKNVSIELEKLLTDYKQRVSGYEKDRALADAINGLGRYQQLPAPLHDDFSKLMDRWIAEDRHMQPEGMATMANMVMRTKTMPASFIDTLVNMATSGNVADARKAVETWNVITNVKGIDGDVGAMITKEVPASKRAAMEQTAQLMQTILSESDPQKSGDAWARSIGKLRDPENTPERAIKLFNDSTGATGSASKPTFDTRLTSQFRDEYGSLVMPLGFEKEFKTAYHVAMTLSGDRSPEEIFDATWERIKGNYTASPIYVGGIQKGISLTNPDDFDVARNAAGTIGTYSAGEYQWVNDYVKDQIQDALDDGRIALDVEDRKALDEILLENEPLGDGLRLEVTDGNRAGSGQFNIVMYTPDGSIRIPVRDADGSARPMLVDPAIVKMHLNSKTQSRLEAEELKKIADRQVQTEIYRQWNQAIGLDPGIPKLSLNPMPEKEMAEWFLTADEAIRKDVEEVQKRAIEGYQKGLERLNNKTVTLPKGTDIGPTEHLNPAVLENRAAGPDVTMRAVAAVEQVLPDGTGGAFMLNVAAVESDFGQAAGAFRASGDRGIMQINDGDMGAFNEIKRRAQIPGDRIYNAALKLKTIGLDVAGITKSDLDKPLVSVAMARLYMLTDDKPIPQDVAGQAEAWKRHYNTVEGAGTVDDFIRKAGKYVLPNEAQAAIDPGEMIPGAVLDMAGNANPANFLAIQPHAQAAALRLASAFGKELRLTPHGGTQPDSRKRTSQHHHGTATDWYVEDYSDADKQRLIALAVSQGYRGVGGYAAGDGKGTIHLDLRAGGKGPGGIAAWWRKKPGVDGNWEEGPAWFVNGIKQGLAMRRK